MAGEGGYIGHLATSTTGTSGVAGGVWNVRETAERIRRNEWPSPATAHPNEPTNLTATVGDTQVSLSWTAPTHAGSSAISGYRIKHAAGSNLGFSPTITNTNSISTAHTITGLTNGTQYAFAVQALNGSGLGGLVGTLSSVVTQTPASTGITPNTDSSARFYLPASQTSITIACNTSTGYYKLSSPGKTDVIGQEYLYTAPTYYGGGQTANSGYSMTGLSSSAAKTVTLSPCLQNGTVSGSIQGISIGDTATNNVTGVDVSGLTSLTTFHAGAVTSTGTMLAKFTGGGPVGTRRMARSIQEVRCVNCDFNQANGYTQPYGPTIYVSSGGWDFANHRMTATALNQMYTDLAPGTGGGGIHIKNNDGAASDNPSIASNYTIHSAGV